MTDRSTIHDQDHPLRHAVDVGIGAAMLLFAFIGIAASDVSGLGTQTYWTILTLAFGITGFALQWMHAAPGFEYTRKALLTVVHWIGVLATILLVYLFIDAGRLNNADTGLLNGVVLALGTFLAGVYGTWRLAVIGAAIGLATAAVAFSEQYMWLLIGLGIVALAALYLVGRIRTRH
jgi:hypothetical protein